MRQRYFTLTVVTLLALHTGMQAQKQATGAQTPAAAEKKNPFSAFTQFSATMNGGIVAQDEVIKMHRAGDRVRLDYSDSERITDLAKGTTWVIHSDRCHKYPHPDVGTFLFASLADLNVERSSTEEKETVDGHPCKIEKLTIKRDDDLMAEWKLWEADDLKGFPVKVEVHRAKALATFQFTDVSLAAPDPSLLKTPKQCRQTASKTPAAGKPSPAATKQAAAAPFQGTAPAPPATPPK